MKMSYHKPLKMAKMKRKTILSVGKDEKQPKFSNIPGKSVNWYNHVRKMFGHK